MLSNTVSNTQLLPSKQASRLLGSIYFFSHLRASAVAVCAGLLEKGGYKEMMVPWPRASVIKMISTKVVAPLILLLAISKSLVHADTETAETRDKSIIQLLQYYYYINIMMKLPYFFTEVFSLFSVVTFPNE